MPDLPKRHPNDLPADAQLCHIVLFTDLAGEREPILCIRDFQATPPKTNGYMLRGEQLKLSERALWDMVLSRGKDMPTMTNDSLSPIKVAEARRSVGTLIGKPKGASSRSEWHIEGVYPKGVQFVEVLCLAEEKSHVLTEILQTQSHSAYEAVRTAQGNVERLQELAGKHGVSLPNGPVVADLQRATAIVRVADGHGWDHEAIERVAAHASACLPDTPAAAAARDAVSGLQVGWRNAPVHRIDVLGDLEDAIGLLAKVRDAAAAEALQQLREHWKHHLGSDALMAFTADNGVPFCARLVFEGDGYGRWHEGSWAVVHENRSPLLEFHDQRFFHNPVGQFTGGRYRLCDLPDNSPEHGLLFDGGVPEWSIDQASLDKVLIWARAYVEQRPESPASPVALPYEADTNDLNSPSP